MGPFSNMILVLGFSLLCSVEVIESSEQNFLQRLNITDSMVRAKCTKSDDKFSTCCNAKLPESCRDMLTQVDGLNCTDVVGSAICTDCCTDLFEAGLAASKEACCPAGLCGDTIGCQPITGDCSCRSLDYFSGTVESCTGLGQSCAIFSDCCVPYGCIENVCSTCAGRNTMCSQTPECCGTDVCVNYKCAACGIENMSCDSNEQCCDYYSCVGGVCKPCVQNGYPCTSTQQCCYFPYYESMTWNYCDKRGSADDTTVGVCQQCLTMDETSQNGGASRCTTTDQCCGTLRCYQGSCVSCAIPNAACNADSDCCDGGCPNSVSCVGGVCVPGSESCTQYGSPCTSNAECCDSTTATWYGSFFQGVCSGMDTDPNGVGVCSFCAANGEECWAYSECCSNSCNDETCVPHSRTVAIPKKLNKGL